MLQELHVHVLNTFRNSESLLGSLFQCLRILLVYNFFLISNINLSWNNLRLFTLVLSYVTWEKRPPLTTYLLSGSCRVWCLPLSLIFFLALLWLFFLCHRNCWVRFIWVNLRWFFFLCPSNTHYESLKAQKNWIYSYVNRDCVQECR